MADETKDPVIKVTEPGKQADIPLPPNSLPHNGPSAFGTPEVHLDRLGQWAPGPAPSLEELATEEQALKQKADDVSE